MLPGFSFAVRGLLPWTAFLYARITRNFAVLRAFLIWLYSYTIKPFRCNTGENFHIKSYYIILILYSRGRAYILRRLHLPTPPGWAARKAPKKPKKRPTFTRIALLALSTGEGKLPKLPKLPKSGKSKVDKVATSPFQKLLKSQKLKVVKSRYRQELAR